MCGISFGWHDDLERKSKVNDSDLFCSPGREREKEREGEREKERGSERERERERE